MKKTILMASILIFTLTGIGFAGPRGFGPGSARGGMLIPPGKWWEAPQLTTNLSLTQEEKEKLDTLYFDYRQRMIDLRSRVQKERLELEQLLNATSFSSETGMQGFKKLQDTRNALAAERFKYFLDIREMMGTERFKKLKAEIREHRMKTKGDRRRAGKGHRSFY